jgi:transposase
MKTCSACGGALTQELPAETSSTIDYVPGRFVKRRHRRQKLACRCGGCIVTAPPPPRLIEGGHYGPGFAAFLVVEKCADSIPIYRVEKRFARLGIPISRSTMNDIIHVAAEVVRPLVARLTTRISDVEIVLADETSVRLQTREKRGFIWVFHGRDEHGSGGELVLYVFATDRSGETPMKILGGSVGALVVDGYTGYNNITDPAQRERAGCWCHARRKFFEAQSTAPAEAKHAIDEIRRAPRTARREEQTDPRQTVRVARRDQTERPAEEPDRGRDHLCDQPEGTTAALPPRRTASAAQQQLRESTPRHRSRTEELSLLWPPAGWT